jgi:hypothetical protein
MLSHLGHFVQSPSGISRFFDFELPSFGFRKNVVSADGGGGDDGGSRVSNPTFFFVKLVVVIGEAKRTFDRNTSARPARTQARPKNQ